MLPSTKRHLSHCQGYLDLGMVDDAHDELESIELEDRLKKEVLFARILVEKISCDGPHTPVSKWSEAKVLPPDTSKESIQQSITELLKDPQYFGMCTECDKRNPYGWMLSKNLCKSCAEKNHGVVF